MKRILKILGILIGIIAFAFIALLVFATATKYIPHERDTVFQTRDFSKLPDSLTINMLTWNIGYCGLGKDMDFFYDGGTHMRCSRENTINNMNAIGKFLKQNDSIDFYNIQEIDKNSHRTYSINEYDSVSNLLKGFKAFFGKNYDVKYVPVPWTEPMGKVLSGIATFAKYVPVSSVRVYYPSKFSWPTYLFMLDRCFLVNRYPLQNGKDLLIVNTHLSAFDDGSLRDAEMHYFRKYLSAEFDKGNYIIVGGDWNQSPEDFKPTYTFKFDSLDNKIISKSYMPENWKWCFDNTAPSNRRVVAPYDPATTLTTVIDFFLLSPNVDLIQLKTINLNFDNSDHNPVIAKFKLKK